MVSWIHVYYLFIYLSSFILYLYIDLVFLVLLIYLYVLNIPHPWLYWINGNKDDDDDDDDNDDDDNALTVMSSPWFAQQFCSKRAVESEIAYIYHSFSIITNGNV
jgi:hypothetical protein